MKKTSRFIFLLILIPALCNAETRTLTDKEGKQIEAEIKAVRDENVTIEMKGKEYTLPFAKFSDDDIAYLKKWVEDNPAPAVIFKESDLTISFKKNIERIKPEKEEKPANNKDKGNSKQTQNSESYLIKVSNTVSKEIPDMQVKYTIYKLVRQKTTGDNKSSSEDLEEVEGTSETTNLDKLANFEFTTDSVIATDSEKSDKKSGSKTTRKEDIWGIITKIYSGDTEIRVDEYPDGLIERVESREEE
ncbi:MAG: hypothetical protein ACSHX7_06270 [Luteolibacter sp.]